MIAYEGNKENYNPKSKNHSSTELRANTKTKEKPPEEREHWVTQPRAQSAVRLSTAQKGSV